MHIDGGHTRRHVLLDFLLYSPSVVPGGFIVFDDYNDFQHSPEVGPAVDLLRATGFFQGFNVLGSVHGFENSLSCNVSELKARRSERLSCAGR